MYDLEITIGIIGFLIAFIVLFLLSLSLKKVNQYEKGLVERFNAYEKTVDPGLRIITPFIERMYRVNMREQANGKVAKTDYSNNLSFSCSTQTYRS